MRLYTSVVSQARDPYFYTELDVPDTPDGRYDMIMIHAFLLLQRLKNDHQSTEELGQAFFDLMFDDMDKNLREMGAGDIGVSHRIKDMAKAFYGRIAAYEAGLREGEAALQEALRRNVYRKSSPSDAQVSALAGYLRDQSAALSAQALSVFTAGRFEFKDIPEPPGQGGKS